jgi:hypothetical protein
MVPKATISEEFSAEVRKASELLDFLLSEGYPYHIPDQIIDKIETARELLKTPGHPSKEDRATLIKAYRDLVNIPQNSVTFDRIPPARFWSMRSSWLWLLLLFAIIPSGIALIVLLIIKAKYWYLPIVYALLALAAFVGFYVFTGMVSNNKLNKIITFCYLFTIVALAMPVLFWIPNLISQGSSEPPLGILRGCASGISTDIPAEVQCTEKNDNYQWVMNIGGVVAPWPGEELAPTQPLPGAGPAVQPSGGTGLAAQQSPPGGGSAAPQGLYRIRGGVVVPLYVIVLALIGSAVSMTRRVPEYQGRAMSSLDPLTNVQAREYLVFQIMQVLSAPLIAITVYYIIKPAAVMTSVVLGFGSGFASEPILLIIRGLVEKLTPAKAAEPSPITVKVDPATVTLQPNQTQQFIAKVLGSLNSEVIWQIDPSDGSAGTVSQSGYYIAPGSVPAKTVTITAYSAADRTKSGSASVIVTPNPVPSQTSPSGEAQLRRIQNLLTLVGAYTGPINGVPDEPTRAAIATYLSQLGPSIPPEPEPEILEQWLQRYLEDRNWRPDRPSGDALPSLAGQSEDSILAQIGDKLAKLDPPAIDRGKATDRDAVLAAMTALENRDQQFRGLGYTGWLRLLNQLTASRT